MKKALITITSGCYSSRTDFDLLRVLLISNGWKITTDIREAELVIVYTCAFIRAREDEAMRIISRIRREKRKSARLIVTGCLPAINKVRLERAFKDIAFIPAGSFSELEEAVGGKFRLQDVVLVKPSGSKVRNPGSKYYNPGYVLKDYMLRIGWGCRGKCSYCVIRRVFGRPRSRPESEIAAEYVNAVNSGYKKFVLVANEAGAYGTDRGTDIVELLGVLNRICKDAKFAISNITPDKLKEVLPRLERFLRRGVIWRINVPVQSASNRILGLMKRPYTGEDFRSVIRKILAMHPQIILETDVMLGFPSETRSEFYETIKLVEWLGRNKVFFQIFPYSRRPHTAAAGMPGQIISKEKRRRCEIMNFLCSSYFVMKNGVMLAKWRKLSKARDIKAGVSRCLAADEKVS